MTRAAALASLCALLAACTGTMTGGPGADDGGGLPPPGTDGGPPPPGTDGGPLPPGIDGGPTPPGTDGGPLPPLPDAGPLGAECGDSPLRALAESMPARSFAELDTIGWTEELLDATVGHNVLQYMTKGVWDASTCQAMLYGGGHLSEMKFLAYVDATNTWTRLPNPEWWCYEVGSYACSTHGYEHNAFISDEGTFLFRYFNSDTIRSYRVTDPPTSDWDTLATIPDPASRCVATAIEYFPDRREVIYVDCTEQTLKAYDLDTGEWSTHGASLAMGAYHNVASYNPVHRVVAFGGGNGSADLHLYGADGTVRTAADAPFWLGTGYDDAGNRHILTVDPRGGRYLAYASEVGLYEYDVATDAWARVDLDVPDNLQIAIPVTSHGVVMFLGRAPEEIWIYKHGS